MSTQVTQNLLSANQANSNMVGIKKKYDSVPCGAAWVNPYESKAPASVKAGVLATTVASVVGALVLIMKHQKLPVKLSEMFKGNYKNWSLWKVNFTAIPIIGLGGASVLGGLAGGAVFDKKKNLKAKFREAIIQFVGNICTPIGCVAAALWAGKKYVGEDAKQGTKNIAPGIKPKDVNELAKCSSKAAKNIPMAICTAVGLVIGVFLGNKIGNLINEKLFHVKDNRKLKLTDMSPHIDDVCFASSMAFADSPIVNSVARIIPIALTVPGFQTGVAREKPNRQV